MICQKPKTNNTSYLNPHRTRKNFPGRDSIRDMLEIIDPLVHRLEKVRIRSLRSQGKLVGTLATVAGAMVMTLMKGPVLEIFGTQGSNINQQHNGTNLQHSIKGSIMITIGCFSWACFMIIQVCS